MKNSNGNNQEHISERQLKDHAARRLAPAELLSVDEHLAACDQCFDKFNEVVSKKTSPVSGFVFDESFDDSFADSAGAHLSYENELEPFVNGTLKLAETEKVENHIRDCRMCAAEIQDLQRFRIRLARAEKINSRETQNERAPSFWLKSFFTRNPSRSALMTGALAVIFVFAAVILFNRRANDAGQIAEVANNIKNSSNYNSPEIALSNSSPASNATPAISAPNSSAANRKTSKTETANKTENELPPEMPREVESALSTGRLAKPKVLEEIAGNPVQLLGANDETVSFAPQSPVSVIRAARPTFRWQILEGATSYTVTVFDSNLRRVAKSDSLKTNQWTPPYSLKAGEVYQWQITALKDGRQITAPAAPAREAKFKILGLRESKDLETSLARAAKSPLARGILFAGAGLLDDAEREFQKEIKQNPNSKKARQMLRQIRAWR